MQKNTLIAVIVGAVILLAAGYMLFLNPSDSSAITTSDQGLNPAELTFVNLTSQLDTLTFNTAILSDPRFIALIDIHTEILPELSGRRDPFAPLSK